MEPPLIEIAFDTGGWVLFGVAALLYFRGEWINRKTHEREMGLVEKRAELAEQRADKAEAQRDELLLPLAAIADRTFRSIPPAAEHDPPAAEEPPPRP